MRPETRRAALEGRSIGFGPGGQADRRAVDRPVALGLFGHGTIVELVTEMAVLLELERGAHFHLVRLV